MAAQGNAAGEEGQTCGQKENHEAREDDDLFSGTQEVGRYIAQQGAPHNHADGQHGKDLACLGLAVAVHL